MNNMKRPIFASIQEYGQLFTDVTYWQPYVEEVCTRHLPGKCQRVRSGLPGTHPVFIVDERYVIKFFTHYFGGMESLAAEMDLYHVFSHNPPLSIPVPTLIAQGTLFPDSDEWPWPYLITNVISGRGLVEVHEQVHYENLLTLADLLGQFLHQLHPMNLSQSHLFKPTWDAFANEIEQQRQTYVARHQDWGTIPTHLIEQIESYLLSTHMLFDAHTTPHLLHCDLNSDHVFGFLDEKQHWHTTGIIDFGDAQVGDWHYDLIALHMGLFCGDKVLLQTFMDSYDPKQRLRKNFVHITMTYHLLRRFDCFERIFHRNPELYNLKSLEELAEILWEV